jgi:hypothetical protein
MLIEFKNDTTRYSDSKNRETAFCVRPEDICYINNSGGAQPQIWISIAGEPGRKYIEEPDAKVLDMLTTDYGFIRYSNDTYVNPDQIQTIKTLSPPEGRHQFLEIAVKNGGEPLPLFDHPASEPVRHGSQRTFKGFIDAVNEHDKKKELGR